jgi:RhoGEF domain
MAVVFLRHMESLGIYESYVKNYSTAMNALQNAQKNSASFRNFLKTFEQKVSLHCGGNLYQRLTRTSALFLSFYTALSLDYFKCSGISGIYLSIYLSIYISVRRGM